MQSGTDKLTLGKPLSQHYLTLTQTGYSPLGTEELTETPFVMQNDKSWSLGDNLRKCYTNIWSVSAEMMNGLCKNQDTVHCINYCRDKHKHQIHSIGSE